MSIFSSFHPPFQPARTVAAMLCAGLLSAAASSGAHAQIAVNVASAPADLQQLRQQLDAMRQQYEARLRDLEARVQAAETQARSAAVSTTAPASSATSQSKPAAAGARSNAFNPAVSLVLSGTYAHLSKDPGTWKMTGFATGDAEVGPGEKGLSLGESEITMSANIDPWWYGALTIALTPENEAEVEEAFVQTTALPGGLKLKAGRFFSGLGYLNEQHAHTWDFVDAPLAYQAFLGGQLGHDGVQLKWLAPTDQYLEFGAEVAKGNSADNGAGASALFAHLGGDVGASNSWRLGLSHLWQRSQERTWQDTDLAGNDVSNAFTGKSRTWVLDGIWKWAPDGNAKNTQFKLQGEYFRRTERGDVVYDAEDTTGSGSPADLFKSAQSGWYVQGVYQFTPAWSLGLRHDQLDTGSVDYAANNAFIDRPAYQPKRTSVMLDWSLSEFSRWRLQVNNDRARQGVSDTQLYLQYQMSLGAHGAHGF